MEDDSFSLSQAQIIRISCLLQRSWNPTHEVLTKMFQTHNKRRFACQARASSGRSARISGDMMKCSLKKPVAWLHEAASTKRSSHDLALHLNHRFCCHKVYYIMWFRFSFCFFVQFYIWFFFIFFTPRASFQKKRGSSLLSELFSQLKICLLTKKNFLLREQLNLDKAWSIKEIIHLLWWD